MKHAYKEKDENKKKNVVAAMIFSALIVLGGVGLLFISVVVGNGFVGLNAILVTQQGVVQYTALSTTIDLGNTTDQMTTLFITLITIMIPLIIIMAYLGIFQDFIGALSSTFSRLFRRQ